ncbi:GntR family transcriptional regulator [Kitasatospora indigofera]|uniref:GntR family transcriptional regulator n=1 Tax=Kitasatospora indigofera TaxID=67307 RepID=UPI00369D95C0
MSAPNRPTFRRIADEIRAAIDNGTYAPGSKLPTDAELAAQMGVTRTLIGDALQLLTTDGIVTKTRKGTFVSSFTSKINRDANTRYTKSFRESTTADGTKARGAFDAELRARGLTPKTDLQVKRVVPPNHVADLLGIPANEVLVVSRARVMFAVKEDGDEVPVQVATSYLPGDIAFGTVLETPDTGEGGLISRLADLGHRQSRISETIQVRRPSEAEATALNLTEDQRVYEITHSARTATDRVVEVTNHILPVHLWNLTYAWDLEG